MLSTQREWAAIPVASGLNTLAGKVRQRYFRNLFDSAISIVCVAIAIAVLAKLFQWAVVDSVWHAKSAAECSQRGTGACWAVIPVRIRLMLFGIYPFEDQWRAAVACVVLLVGCILSCIPYFWQIARLATIWIISFAAFLALMRGGFLGLPLDQLTSALEDRGAG